MATLVTGRMVQDGTVAANDLQPGLAVPTGAIMAFGMSTPPVGWLPCDGVAISRTTFSALFSAIGTTYGVGDNSTTFNVPNLQGQFVRGWTSNQTTTSRDPLSSTRVLGNVQNDEFKQHTHNYYDYLWEGAQSDPPSSAIGATFGAAGLLYRYNYTRTTISSDPAGISETRPVNIALFYCIKA